MGLFGNITRALFGGSKQTSQSQSTSESGNRFAGQVNEQFSPWVSQGTAGMGRMANILGLGGPDASSGALNDWWNSSGGNFLLNQGMDQIMGNRAAGGLLRSSGTGEALEDYRQGLASTKLNEYLGHLGNLSQLGLGAGGLITGAGQYGTSQSTSQGKGTSSTGGLGQALGTAMATFSDRRLKRDIRKLGEEADGLGRYRFRYIGDDTMREGVMADEVARLRPHALGPVIGGYATVRYDLLEDAR